MIATAQVEIGDAGSTLCSRCQERSGAPADVSLVTERLHSLASSWSGSGPPGVTFVGFEPFAHPDLPRIVSDAVDAGFARVVLRTDAGALGMSGNAAGVIGAGVRAIEVVLLGGTAAEHDALAGVPGLFDAARAGVAAFRSAAERAGVRVALTGLVPVCRHDMEFVAGATAALAAMGAVAVELACDSGRSASDPRVVAALETAAVNGVAAWRTTAGEVVAGDLRPWAAVR